jgi:hypothetical protein
LNANCHQPFSQYTPYRPAAEAMGYKSPASCRLLTREEIVMTGRVRESQIRVGRIDLSRIDTQLRNRLRDASRFDLAAQRERSMGLSPISAI